VYVCTCHVHKTQNGDVCAWILLQQAEAPNVSVSCLQLHRRENCNNPCQLPANCATGTGDQQRQQAKGKGYWQNLEAAGTIEKGNRHRHRHWQRQQQRQCTGGGSCEGKGRGTSRYSTEPVRLDCCTPEPWARCHPEALEHPHLAAHAAPVLHPNDC